MSGQARRNCPACGGTGRKRIMVYTTVWESQTVNEWVTVWRLGKPVRVMQPRVVRKPVQKPEYKSVVCSTCGGSGKA